MDTGYRLLDDHVHRDDPDLRPWYTTRRTCGHGLDRPHLIVIHTPEALPDYDGPDSTAERVAEYGTRTGRASWHDTVDSDSHIPMLPASHTAWHVRNFNRCAIGLEVGARAQDWPTAPADWIAGVLTNAAAVTARHILDHGIRPRIVFDPTRTYTVPHDTPADGLISHHALDPTRRSDPGRAFPWPLFLVTVRYHLGMDTAEELAGFTYLNAGEWPDWAAPSIRRAIISGVIRGRRPPGTPEDSKLRIFPVDEPVSRTELAVIFDRAGLLDR